MNSSDLFFFLQEPMTDSPTYWLPALQDGDEKAAEQFWKEYFLKAVRLAKRRMQGLRFRAADEEDIALSAMKSFCQMAKRKETPIEDSQELWKLLATIVRRKANKERQRQFAGKRQEHRLQGESVWEAEPGEDIGAMRGIGQIEGRDPSPELALHLAETWERILESPKSRELVLLKHEGLSNSEIAAKLGCSTRTVQRDLERIHKEWEGWQKDVQNEWDAFPDFTPPLET